ncbi:MAG: hypothetical protein PHQ13_02735, partial [Rhodoferax sp.]|nr:hypothetical protein [Rhodoferax sp.]
MSRFLTHLLPLAVLTLSLGLGSGHAWGKPAKTAKAHTNTRVKPSAKPTPPPVKAPQDGVAEARLIEVYRLIGKADTHNALQKAERLVKDFPTFALA